LNCAALPTGVRGADAAYDPQVLEAAARREVGEETHIERSSLRYLGNQDDDWSYRNENDKVTTTVFLARYMFGAIQPDDDIEELKWFRLNREFDLGCLVASHKPH
jgi:NADH pyrophosphatase NudC (nudix superfamily)